MPDQNPKPKPAQLTHTPVKHTKPNSPVCGISAFAGSYPSGIKTKKRKTKKQHSREPQLKDNCSVGFISGNKYSFIVCIILLHGLGQQQAVAVLKRPESLFRYTFTLVIYYFVFLSLSFSEPNGDVFGVQPGYRGGCSQLLRPVHLREGL